jgi:hypothetical protein
MRGHIADGREVAMDADGPQFGGDIHGGQRHCVGAQCGQFAHWRNACEPIFEALDASSFLIDADERRHIARRFDSARQAAHIGAWAGIALKQNGAARLQLFNGAQISVGRNADGQKLCNFLTGKTHSYL